MEKTPHTNFTNEDTICAIATGTGGAIGIIRISGPKALSITDHIFLPHGSRSLLERPTATIAYGSIIDERHQIVDEVLVSIFRAPHSYTGEDSTEISCHNSTYILQTILKILTHNGCRLAEPGEYSKRAFVNGKMDLSQAESVADLIASTSAAAHKLAMNQMRGGFSKLLKQLRDQLLHIASLMELELDFSDHEDLEFADRTELSHLLTEIEDKIRHLASSFQAGNAIKEGIPVAIVGQTNVGKSTLLNALLGEDKAIVSSINGTTRDVIEDTITLDGLMFRFIDTAGIRQTNNEIEQLGIQKTFQKIEQATIVLWLVDAGRLTETMQEIRDRSTALKDKNTLLIINKCDLLNDTLQKEISLEIKSLPYSSIFISARTGNNLDLLRHQLVTMTHIPENIEQEDVIVSNQRHYEALCKALESILRIRRGMEAGNPTDILTEDLRDCIYHLSDIVGEVTSSDVLQNIFSHFCIGK
ncbi:MAG: tRNA uridine-5-carboxymethylaminomethyl(34) synthesis GTPase MnmE [Bacteroidaceae bacterium]|jgi:tRNA modification GTPase|nr:tRNA uridine-5-carboxymethylaminomethyl(34) synthesis GTPase MnmE [Bacteroidaceae bacterium]